MFERLYRSQTAIANEPAGAGIGLSIAAPIISAHNSTIQVIETSKSGTTFGINLPVPR